MIFMYVNSIICIHACLVTHLIHNPTQSNHLYICKCMKIPIFCIFLHFCKRQLHNQYILQHKQSTVIGCDYVVIIIVFTVH